MVIHGQASWIGFIFTGIPIVRIPMIPTLSPTHSLPNRQLQREPS